MYRKLFEQNPSVNTAKNVQKTYTCWTQISRLLIPRIKKSSLYLLLRTAGVNVHPVKVSLGIMVNCALRPPAGTRDRRNFFYTSNQKRLMADGSVHVLKYKCNIELYT